MAIKIILALLSFACGFMYTKLAFNSPNKFQRVLNIICAVLWFMCTILNTLSAFGF